MSENWSVQVSLKTPQGTLINLRAENGDNIEPQLAWLTRTAPAIVAAEQAFGGVAAVAQAFPGAQVTQQTGPSWAEQGSQQSAQPAADHGKMCAHGARKRVVMKRGTKDEYLAFFCPAEHLPKDQQCKAEWGK